MARSAGRCSTRGVTLVELLVAITITITVMSGVALLFVAALRAQRQGNQSMVGYEITRGLFNQIERDLTTGLATRDFGENFQFYGTPLGMMFVTVADSGPITSLQRSGVNAPAGNPNLSRVTYVLYLNAEGREGIERGEFQDPQDPADRMIRTYTMLRYVEPGVSNIDTFSMLQFDLLLNQYRYMDMTEYAEFYGTDELGRSLKGPLEDFQNPIFPDSPDKNVYSSLAGALAGTSSKDVVEQLRLARRRELWIRMLAGDPALPPFWKNPANPDDPRPDPRDYIIAEHILLENFLVPEGDRAAVHAEFPILASYDPAPKFPYNYYLGRPIFSYGRTAKTNYRGSDYVLSPYWNSAENFFAPPISVGVGAILDLLLNQVGFGGDPGLQDEITRRVRDELAPGGLDNNAIDILDAGNPPDAVSNLLALWKEAALVPTPADPSLIPTELTGTPLAPRIPEMVHVRIKIMMESPFAGAPVFSPEPFEQVFHIPTGYFRPDLFASAGG